MKTLIVESDLMSQCVLAKLLTERGHEVVCFENAEQAILAYEKEPHPLVFVNADLPGMDGLQLCRWLRAQPAGDEIYLILACSPRQPSDLNQVLTVGASDFLLKPFDLASLKLRLTVAEQHMASFFRERELRAQLSRHDQQSDGLQGELERVREALEKEAGARLELEEETERLRNEVNKVQAAFDERLREQALDLCSAADELQSATAFRSRIEDDLRKVQQELQLQSARHVQESAALRAELSEEKARHRGLSERHQKLGEEMQARVRELIALARQADERRQQSEGESQRAAAAFARAQAEWEERRQELVAQVCSLREQLESAGTELQGEEREKLMAEMELLRSELTSAREDFAGRMALHTRELLRMDEALQSALEARRRVEAEMVQLREELSAKTKDYVSALVKVGEEMETALAEDRRRREELEQGLREQEGQVDELRASVRRGETERRELEEELQKAWEQLEAGAAGSKAVGLERMEAELEAAQRSLADEVQRRQRAEQLLAQAQERLQAQLRRLAAVIEPVDEVVTMGAPGFRD
jgi:DNA-binding response OmpR family regulator